MKTALCQSTSSGVTQAFGRKLVDNLTSGGTITLVGELGAGKTTFVQGVAEALGIAGSVTSPTFTLMNVYETNHPVIKQLVHADLYRITDASSIVELDLPTWMHTSNALVIVEWPERAPELFQHSLGNIELSLGDTPSQRKLVFTGEIATVFQP